MLSVTEAQGLIAQQVRPLPPTEMALCPEALGLILAENIVSDLDMPPYDKALMDGYAVRLADFTGGVAELRVIEEVTAGRCPTRDVELGEATRIMTGAPVPRGIDAVVMSERSRMLDEQRVRLEDAGLKAGQNILRQGREIHRGEVVLKAGAKLRPQEFGILGTLGRARIFVQPAPAVAVVPTGDEIVEVHETPGPGQIRNGNGPMLLAQTARAGGVPHFLGIARDTLESLRTIIGAGLEYPVLVLSGGVSAGKLDLVPSVLEEMGVRPYFHKVQMKPGRPLFFGVRERADRVPTLVFGLPGNPVSSLVCFELFVRPALRGLRGLPAEPRMIQAALVETTHYKTDRPTYHPAHLTLSDAGWQVRPVPWFGSPDLRGALPANAFAFFPEGERTFAAGEKLAVLLVEEIE